MSDEATETTGWDRHLTPEQALRCYVLENYPYGEYEPVHVLIKSLDAINSWLKTGDLPEEPKAAAKSKSHLKPVPKPENPNGSD